MTQMLVFMLVMLIGVGGGVQTLRAQSLLPVTVIPGTDTRAVIAGYEAVAASAGGELPRQPRGREDLWHNAVRRGLPDMILPAWTDAVRQQRIDRHICSAA